MGFEHFDNLPIQWEDHEDIAMKLYEKFGDDFDESRIYRIRFTDLIEWIISLPNFVGKEKIAMKAISNKSRQNGSMNGATINKNIEHGSISFHYHFCF